jgi:hypothetical protein
METPKPPAEDWAAAMSRQARELLEMRHGDPALLDSDPVQALKWLEAELAGFDAIGFTTSQRRSLAVWVMAFIAEVIIGLYGAHWVTYPLASPTDRHVLQGGRLQAPIRMGPLVLRAFREPRVSVVVMLHAAESEGRISVGTRRRGRQ